MRYYLLVFVATCLFARAPAQPAVDRSAGAEQVVVLRNGRALRGRVSKEDKRYRVSLDYGDILLRADEVSAVCRDLEDAYKTLDARGDSKSIDHHLRMALWCLEQGLTGHAREQLDAAKAIDPDDRRAAYVARRLVNSQVRIEPARTPPGGADRNVANVEALDRLVRNLPQGTAEAFSRAIQPLLLSRCATSACHGVSSNQKLRLLRPLSSRGQTARITQRNLHSVFQYIDPEQPRQSKLLAAATLPHGGLPDPVLGEPDKAQIEQLVTWIENLAERPDDERPTRPATVSVLRPPAWDDHQLGQMRPPAGFLQPAAASPGAAAEQAHDQPDPVTQPAADGGAGLVDRDQTSKNDAFDPAIFNRRFAKKRR